jgi:hypothetical protein
MVVVYPIGIPLLYFYVLYYNREAIMYGSPSKVKAAVLRRGLVRHQGFFRNIEENMKSYRMNASMRQSYWRRARSASQVSLRSSIMHNITPKVIYFLHQSYEPQYWYWEIIETVRRLLLTAVVSVVSTGTMVN